MQWVCLTLRFRREIRHKQGRVKALHDMSILVPPRVWTPSPLGVGVHDRRRERIRALLLHGSPSLVRQMQTTKALRCAVSFVVLTRQQVAYRGSQETDCDTALLSVSQATALGYQIRQVPQLPLSSAT